MSDSFRPPVHSSRKSSIPQFTAFLLTGLIPVCAITFAGIAGVAAAEKPAASAKVKHGETVFKTNCITCHNKAPGDTTPFGPPNLHGIIGNTPPLVTPQQAVETIKQGKGVMPSFDGKLTAGEISDVVAYLKTQ